MNKLNKLYLVFTLWIAAGSAWAADALEPVLKDRGQHFQTEGKIVPIEKDGIHDPGNPAVRVLQPPSEALTGFPRDDAGVVDWAQAIKQGLIAPRASIDGSAKQQTLDLDITFTDTGAMPHVRFSHLSHTQTLDCANCHPAIFVQKKGANNIAMDDVYQGKYCGLCHGKVAFPATLNCARCHSGSDAAGKQ